MSIVIAHNVLEVSDLFLLTIRKNAKHFYGRKIKWRSKTYKERKPDWVLSSLAAVRQRTVTDLLCVVALALNLTTYYCPILKKYFITSIIP